MNSPLHLDSGARALDALPADEAAAFDAHLPGCESCTDEYAEFLETTALLGSAAAEQPPESLHVTLMRLIAVTPQSPPPDLRAPTQIRSEHPRPWYRRPAALMAAAVAALVVIAGGVVIAVRGADQGPMTADQCVQQATDLRVSNPSVGDGGTVRYSETCGAAIVSAPDMPDLPTDRDYQLWVMAGTDAVSVGVVPAQAVDSGLVVQVGPTDTDIGISVEPKGGSPAPTTDPIWVVPLP